MKLAVFSDIHGNIDAFRAVLTAIKALSPDRYIFCGDICGYYYDQLEVISELMRLSPLVAVQGNHEAQFLGSLENENQLDTFSRRYGSTYRRLRERIDPRALSFLKELPVSVVSDDHQWAVFHGSPWAPLRRIYLSG